MNINNWKELLKYHNGEWCLPQRLYQPLVNPEKTIFCKNYNYADQIAALGNNYVGFHNKSAVEYFFRTEICYLQKLANLSFAPNILDIDYKNKRIFIEWNDYYCNEHIYFYNNWPIDDWLKQLKDIVIEQCSQGIYKLTLDSHSHFIDKNGNLKAINYYGVVPINYPFIPKQIAKSYYQEYFTEKIFSNDLISHNLINAENKFKRSLQEKVKWGDYSLIEIYNHLFS